MNDTMPGFDLATSYIHLEASGAALSEAVDAGFWERLGRAGAHDQPHRLMGEVHGSQGSSDWEMHPNGDEVLWLLEGDVDIVMEQADRSQQVVALHSGYGCVVPRGQWHQQVWQRPGRLLFVTAGAGTEHRD